MLHSHENSGWRPVHDQHYCSHAQWRCRIRPTTTHNHGVKLAITHSLFVIIWRLTDKSVKIAEKFSVNRNSHLHSGPQNIWSLLCFCEFGELLEIQKLNITFKKCHNSYAISSFPLLPYLLLLCWVPKLFNLCLLCIPLPAWHLSLLPPAGSPCPWLLKDCHLALLLKVLYVPWCSSVSSVAILSHSLMIFHIVWFNFHVSSFVFYYRVILFCQQCLVNTDILSADLVSSFVNLLWLH